MYSSVSSLLNNSSKLDIICAPTHERCESSLAKTGHEFWAWKKTGVFKPTWNTNFAPIPENYHLLDERRKDNQLYPWISPQCVLSQNKFGQYEVLARLANLYHIPLITYEHTSRMTWWNKEQLSQLHQMRGSINVFIAESQIEDWKWEERDGDTYVIRHAIDTDLFKPAEIQRQNYILSVANDFIGRDSVLNFSQFKRVVLDKNLPFKCVGDTKGLSQAPQNVQELVKEYQNARILVNTHHISPIPMSLLEGMATGCCVVSCNTNEIPYYIKHGENGLLYNNDEEMAKYLNIALNDEDMCKELGNKARETIIKECNIDRYVREWNNLFDLARRMK